MRYFKITLGFGNFSSLERMKCKQFENERKKTKLNAERKRQKKKEAMKGLRAKRKKTNSNGNVFINVVLMSFWFCPKMNVGETAVPVEIVANCKVYWKFELFSL